MAHRVCFSHSESFLEASSICQKTGNAASTRYYLPKLPLEKAIAEFWSQSQIGDVSSVILSLKATKTIIKKRLGTPPAVIVTEGFENWLDMNLPIETPQLTLEPLRARSPLNSDLIFGLHERTDHLGNIIHSINIKELEFLVSKLQMSKANTICVCLLHSNKNPENEKQVESYFAEKGFRVFCSYHADSDCHERERWMGAILNGYLLSSLEGELEAFEKVESLQGHHEKIHLATGAGLEPVSTGNIHSTALGDVFLLDQFRKTLPSGDNPIYHFGLEECFRLEPGSESQCSTASDVGSVSSRAPKHRVLSWNFTQPLRTQYWGVGELIADNIGYEPGPMCFGRGLQPTLLDLLFLDEDLEEVIPLGNLIDKKMRPRIFDSLSSLVKDLKLEILDKALLQQTLKLSLFELASELHGETEVLFSGPMAAVMKQVLENHYNLKNIVLIENHAFLTLNTLKVLEAEA